MDYVRICQICEIRSAVIQYSSEAGDSLPQSVCMMCLKRQVRNGEADADFLRNLIQMMPSNKKEKQEIEYSAPSNKKTKRAPTLESLGKDMTEEAASGKLDPVTGRQKEIAQMVRVLCRRSKNNPVLVGEPGVGKTAIVEGLAQNIANGTVPEMLKNKTVFAVSIGNVVAGTKYRGEFEDRMKKIIEEVDENGDIILFIDEIHSIIGAGGAEGAVDASNILKPALSRGRIQIIGATTIEEYTKHVEKDAALERRFQKVSVGEPTAREAEEILIGLRPQYEAHHQVKITDEAIQAAVKLSIKYVSDRFLPDKAIDLIDEACASKRMSLSDKPEEIALLEKKLDKILKKKEELYSATDYEASKKILAEEKKLREIMEKALGKHEKEKEKNTAIDQNDIANILCEWTGIPVSRLNKEEKERLKTLEQDLNGAVKGQEEAVKTIAKAIRRNGAGLKQPNRPAGVFLLLGPTGVGKTELAKNVARLIFGSEDNMIRFDMSEFMESHSISKLIGTPPGYVGYDDGGKLTKMLRRKPYSLVLFDEVEKAHPDVFNVMLQLYEEGRITDSKGRVVDGKNAIFLMTSNAGSELYAKGKTLGFSTSDENKTLKDNVHARLKQTFRPEFLNRLDDIIIFNKLPQEVMDAIVEKMLSELRDQLAEKEIDAEFTKELIDFVAKKGFNPEYGARTIRREIDKIRDLIADKLIEEENCKKLTVSVKENEICIP